MEKLPDNRIALKVEEEVARVIKGLPDIIRLVNVALFAQGHILLVGLPGVAKTTLFLAFAKTIAGGFSRISGNPDIMPMEFSFEAWPRIEKAVDSSDKAFKISDLSYYFGPLLKHGSNLAIVLVDEINRIQSKTQAGLLEAMEEKRITCGTQRFEIPYVIFVATRNPLETEQTYELPEAQRDRFMFEGRIEAPPPSIRKKLIEDPRFQDMHGLVEEIHPVIENLSDLQVMRRKIQNMVGVSDKISDYIVRLSAAMLKPHEYIDDLRDEEKNMEIVRAGLSPRGEIRLAQASRVVAWMNGRDYVLPQDIHEIFLGVCSHRFFLERTATRHRSGLVREILEKILEKIPSP